jgi:hypothetical protein
MYFSATASDLRSIDLSTPMFLKLFRKAPEARPRLEQDPILAEDLARRVSAIQFRPSKGFLKDQKQPKRSAGRAQRSA